MSFTYFLEGKIEGFSTLFIFVFISNDFIEMKNSSTLEV